MTPHTPSRGHVSSNISPAFPQHYSPSLPVSYMSPHTCPWRFQSFYATSPYESNDFSSNGAIYHTLQTTLTSVPLAGLGIYLPDLPNASGSQDDFSSLRTFSSLGTLFTHRRRVSRTLPVYDLYPEQPQPSCYHIYSPSDALIKSEPQSPCDLTSVLRSEFLTGNTTPQVADSTSLVEDSSEVKIASLMEEREHHLSAEAWTLEQISDACKLPSDVLAAHISENICLQEGIRRPKSDYDFSGSLKEKTSLPSTADVKGEVKTPDMKLPVADINMHQLNLSQLPPSTGIDPAELSALLYKYAIVPSTPLGTHPETGTVPSTPVTCCSVAAPCSPAASYSLDTSYSVGIPCSPTASASFPDAPCSSAVPRFVGASFSPKAPYPSCVRCISNSLSISSHASAHHSPIVSISSASSASQTPTQYRFPAISPSHSMTNIGTSAEGAKPSDIGVAVKVSVRRKHEVFCQDRQLRRSTRYARRNYNEQTSEDDNDSSAYCPSALSSPTFSTHQRAKDKGSSERKEMGADLEEVKRSESADMEGLDESLLLGTPILDAHKGISIIELRARAERYRLRNLGQDYDKGWLILFAGKLSYMGEHMKDYRCYVTGCGQVNKRRDHILIHVGGHLNQRLFKCAHCSSRFLRKNECKRHELSHSGVRPFACDCCSVKFVRKDLLRRHMQRVHSNDDPRANKENVNTSHHRPLKKAKLQ